MYINVKRCNINDLNPIPQRLMHQKQVIYPINIRLKFKRLRFKSVHLKMFIKFKYFKYIISI